VIHIDEIIANSLVAETYFSDEDKCMKYLVEMTALLVSFNIFLFVLT